MTDAEKIELLRETLQDSIKAMNFAIENPRGVFQPTLQKMINEIIRVLEETSDVPPFEASPDSVSYEGKGSFTQRFKEMFSSGESE